MNHGPVTVSTSSARWLMTTLRDPSQLIDNLSGCATFASRFPIVVLLMKLPAVSSETPPEDPAPEHCRRNTLTLSKASGEDSSHRTVFVQGRARCTSKPIMTRPMPKIIVTPTVAIALPTRLPTFSCSGLSDPRSSGGGSANASSVSSFSETGTSERICLASLARSGGTQMKQEGGCGPHTRLGTLACERRAETILAEGRSWNSATLTQSSGSKLVTLRKAGKYSADWRRSSGRCPHSAGTWHF